MPGSSPGMTILFTFGEARVDQAEEHVGDRVDEAVLRVDHVEGDQPAQDGAGDDHPDIEVDDENDESDQRYHQDLLGWREPCSGEAAIRARGASRAVGSRPRLTGWNPDP